MTTQTITSAKTDLKQVPAILKLLKDNLMRPALFWAETREILDYGGGAGDKLTTKLAKLGVRNLILDPFNRSAEHNTFVRSLLKVTPADHAFCSNVLNVIKEPAVRMEALREIAELTDPEGWVFITVYEGDKSSRGKRTKDDCWQANRPLKSYVREVHKIFQWGEFFASGKVLRVSGRRKAK